MLKANKNDEVLLRTKYANKETNGFDLKYFVYRAGALLPVTAPDGYKPNLLAFGMDDQGRVLVRLNGKDSIFGDAWALIRP